MPKLTRVDLNSIIPPSFLILQEFTSRALRMLSRGWRVKHVKHVTAEQQ